MRSHVRRTPYRPASLIPDDNAHVEEVSRRGYRRFAPLYDYVFGRGLHDARKIAVEALACQPDERILEVCIGSGLSLDLYPKNADIVGIDLSHEMLVRAMHRLRRHPKLDVARCDLVQMNAERLAFPDATFDKAIVLFGVAGLPNPALAMHELRRVCRPDARIVIASRFRSTRSWFSLYDMLAAPLYRFLAYRSDLDREAFVTQSGLRVLESSRANLGGYATVLVCSNG